MNKDQDRKAAFARRKKAHTAPNAAELNARAQAHLTQALDRFKDRPLAGFMPIRTEINPLPVMAL